MAFQTGKNVLLLSAANLEKTQFEGDARAGGRAVGTADSKIVP